MNKHLTNAFSRPLNAAADAYRYAVLEMCEMRSKTSDRQQAIEKVFEKLGLASRARRRQFTHEYYLPQQDEQQKTEVVLAEPSDSTGSPVGAVNGEDDAKLE